MTTSFLFNLLLLYSKAYRGSPRNFLPQIINSFCLWNFRTGIQVRPGQLHYPEAVSQAGSVVHTRGLICFLPIAFLFLYHDSFRIHTIPLLWFLPFDEGMNASWNGGGKETWVGGGGDMVSKSNGGVPLTIDDGGRHVIWNGKLFFWVNIFLNTINIPYKHMMCLSWPVIYRSR